ncbi:MAG: ATP-dependent DNA helicase RecQ [Planctomycetaceae bacterium]
MSSSQSPMDVLRSTFGFETFRPGQGAVIEHLLAGHSAAAVFPTGSGKSLCYQLPALMLPGLTVVVSPLIALMKDQIDKLKQLGVAAERLDSTLTADESAGVMTAMRAGQLRLLYVAPERFNNERFREAIQRVRVSLFAVDEAHCISEWGHNFRPDYLKLTRFARECRAERLFALTATATPAVLEDICRQFQIEPAHAVRTGFYRSNLSLRITPVSGSEQDAMLLDRLTRNARGPTIVYVTLQRTAEQVADRLARRGFDARAYHAGMKDEDRATVQDWFAGSDRAIVVATIAFGMGIDKANIRYVYHYNLPKSLENYSQEIGRAGRDGAPAHCELLACSDDINTLENFVFGDTPSFASVSSLVREVFQLGDAFDLSLYDLSFRHDIKQIVVRTLLTYLELDGYLEEGTPFYAEYQFKPLVPSKEILAHFEGERQDFLKRLFGQATKAAIWFSLDLANAATKLDQPRDRLIRALDYCAEKQWLELKVAGVRNRYRRLKSPADLTALATELYEKALLRETREIARLNEVLELVAHDGCQVSQLGAHFGEPLPAPCGHCSHCLDKQATQLLPRHTPAIDERRWQQAVAFRETKRDLFADSRAFVRFLCGLSSPKLGRARLGSHALFGVFEKVPFSEVLRRANEQKNRFV